MKSLYWMLSIVVRDKGRSEVWSHGSVHIIVASNFAEKSKWQLNRRFKDRWLVSPICEKTRPASSKTLFATLSMDAQDADPD